MPGARLTGWVERYGSTHPGLVVSVADGGLRLDADGGAYALLVPLLPFAPPAGAGDLVAMVAEHAGRPVVTALVLIRRGGFAVGIATGPTLVASKVGTRYVQSRTAAGGWSQQRFARRREGQARDLVRAAADAWAQLPPTDPPVVVVTGGDRGLSEQLLEQPATRTLRALGVARHLDVPDPRLVVLQDAAARAHALLVTVHEP